MRSIKVIGLCLAAVFALSAIVAASASAAAPEYKACVKASKVNKKYTGTFSNKECTDAAAEGKYELAEVTPGTTFTGKAKTGVLNSYNPLENNKSVGKIECKKASELGEIINAKQAVQEVTFSKCTTEGGSVKCGSPAASGEIHTSAIVSTLVWLNSAKTKPGSIEYSTEGPEHPQAEFECATIKVRTYGALLGEITGNENKASEDMTTVYKAVERPAPYLEQQWWAIEENFAEPVTLATEQVGVCTFPTSCPPSSEETEITQKGKVEIEVQT